ncbi:MAG: tail fiber domain-containing protein [Methanothrix sp.]|nr:tail fiber domain-containing protein [Methanothrix sp.]
MAKSFWMSDQKGNFSNNGNDTFDETKDYIGIRLQQGVPLLDRDWNELEDIRRYQDWVLRDKYLGDGTPDNGFAITLIAGKVDDFNISMGRCLVDGFEAVNRADITYLKQKAVPPLTIPPEKRTDLVYIDLWISEVHGTDDLKNNQDVKIETSARQMIEWRVLVNETGKELKPEPFHHYYVIASMERNGAAITSLKDLRTALRINPLFRSLSVSEAGNIGIGTASPSSPLAVRARGVCQELISFEDSNGKTKWHINQNLGGNNPGLNFVETGVLDGRLFLKPGGYAGINTVNPQRSLHVEGSEIHSSGTGAGFSFANRNAPNNGAFVDSGADGQRWNWYAWGQAARLWAGSDKLVVDKNGNITVSHGPQKGVKVADNVGLKLISADGGGVICGFNLDHSIFFRIGQDGAGNVTDYHQFGTHRFFSGGALENQAERMRITASGTVGIGTTDPKRTLHVDGSEIHSGNTNGGFGGFSFANRDAPNNGAYVDSGADGQRWVWYAAGGTARLWAAGDKLAVDKDGNLNLAGGITFSGNASRRIYGDIRAGSQAVVLKGNWDELEVKGRVIDWTGSNFHIGFQNDHSEHFVYIGAGSNRVKGVEINHGPLKGVKEADNVGLKLNSVDGGGLIYSFDMNHSIFFRIGQDGAGNVTDYHQYGMHRFFTGGKIEDQKERMRITSGGAVGIGTTDPKRMLHVEGSEIHSGGGPTAGFSFANKDAPNNGAFVENGANGQRWVWHAMLGTARLWAGGDKFWVDRDGNVGAAGKIPTSSDLRLKTSIEPLNDVLSRLEKIRAVYFEWNDVYKSLGGCTDRREIGLIAQEVEAVFPEVVMDWGDKGYLGIDYGRFSTVLVEAVKELNSIIKGLNERIEHLERKAAIK